MNAEPADTLRHVRAPQVSRVAQGQDLGRSPLHPESASGEPGVPVCGDPRHPIDTNPKTLRSSRAPLPLYRVGRDGRVQAVARIALIEPQGSSLDMLKPLGWPLDESMHEGWFDGLPYPLNDMRPQGFLGRHFARRHAALLQNPCDPETWSDDDGLKAMLQLGDDLPGDLIVGEAACRLWMARVRAVRDGIAPSGLSDDEIVPAFCALAETADTGGMGASPIGGEFPKFTARRVRKDGTQQHVLVKFSGSDDAPGTQRWADLLVCEHLAGEVLRSELGVAAATSRVHVAGQRTFLEVDRFDRHGALGRSPVISWAALNAALVGLAGRPWTEGVKVLHACGWVDADVLSTVQTVWLYGQLIGNTDMHDGNLSFRPVLDAPTPRLVLAPIYDMLPMRYAPMRGVELPSRTYAPQLPLPAEGDAWQAAARAALCFWQRAAEDVRISGPFRQLCTDNAQTLARLLD
ncbi:type II toxin-antitoxin system HipA family toxin YjjJ [Roseateles amylovorans]|uniref:Type II toxin-antitoxin system HipA family toxin YjjJ n=1 Tax=Roseateles amylovorans TaxID=2978473 RepID=A0ABY6B2V3_9BURK|nr:type II toxin-antitoxin system HipA family toxin YjjJ [Roseateles amylovorans]UXH78304.1 type II toxin-antitoxin system HipA family toxin YjjJ [Roseateles amylovorans]